jgi:hypothetical protein
MFLPFDQEPASGGLAFSAPGTLVDAVVGKLLRKRSTHPLKRRTAISTAF